MLLVLSWQTNVKASKEVLKPIALNIEHLVPLVAKKPDYTKEVLEPLRAKQAQAVQEAARRAEEAKREQETRQHEEAARTIVVAPSTQSPVVTVAPQQVSYGNSYTRGQCTYYVASRVSVPAGMGNATNWSYGLAQAGWQVGTGPVPGAIGISHEGYAGHVVIVEAVTLLGVLISEMNYHGVGVVDTRVVPASAFTWAVR